MITNYAILFAAVACAFTADGAPRASADYSMAAETADSGGRRTTSANYTNDGSAGMVAGISTVPSPAVTAKQGFIGQLYEVTALQLAATPASVNEGGTRQLGGAQLLDDGTVTNVPAASIAWSVVAGPLSGISGAGLATAATVYQDTPAMIQGVSGGFTGTLGLTILNVNADDFGSYAGDGLADDWQVQYFGQGNPDAGPLMDPDFDGQNNRFEFLAGIVPTDGYSRFLLRVEPVSGQPGQMNVIFSPRLAGRNYNVLTSTTLLDGSWTALAGGITSDNGTERTVTDPAAGGTRKFYRVGIVKP